MTTPESIAELIQSRDRSAAGPTAPPQGLCLMEVEYAYEEDGPTPS